MSHYLGTCCSCEREPTEENPVRTLVMLDYKIPPGMGSGWGCVQCGLALEGACAVVCDECAEKMRFAKAEINYIMIGEHDKLGRLSVAQIEAEFHRIPHFHDLSKHEELEPL